MMFYRSLKGSRDTSLSFVRLVSASTLAAYPAGALLLALGPDVLLTVIIGYGLICVSLIGFALLVGSSVQRIVGDEVKLLDEYQLRLRGRAMSASYATFTVFALLVVLYASIASDFGLWMPNTFDGFNGLFWGVFLYASLLPTAMLSWIVDPTFSAPSEESL